MTDTDLTRTPITILINSLGKGGAERQVSLLAKKVPIKRIILLTQDIRYEVPSHIEVVVLSEHYSNGITETLKWPFYLFKLSQLVDRDDPVLSFLTRSNQLNVLLSFVKKHGCYVSERIYSSHEYRHGLKRLLKPLVRHLYKRATHVFVNSAGIKQDLSSNFDIPDHTITVVRNGIESEQGDSETPIPQELATLKPKKILMNVGRFHPQKNQVALIRAFARFAAEYPEWCLVIIGDGPLMNECRALVEKLGLEEQCRLLGSRPEPRTYLRHADAFIFPSHYEGFPNGVLEALAEGLPVLSSDCLTGPREILDNKDDYEITKEAFYFGRYGGLIPLSQDDDENVDRLSRSMQTFLNDEAQLHSYQTKAKHRAQDFDVNTIAQQWLSALTSLELRRKR